MIYSLENEFITVKIRDLGAELCSYFDKKSKREIIWQADPKHWKRHAPILFPIVGKVLNNIYLFEKKKYTMSQHGFARDQIFDLVEKSNTSIKLKISSSLKTRKIFPFNFILFIQFSITEKELKVLYTVENTSLKKIYFSLGGHPGFNCPFNDTSVFSDYTLNFESKESSDRILLNNKGFRSGKRANKWLIGNSINLSEKLFTEDALIFDDLESKFLTIESEKSEEKVKIGWNNYPHLGIWNPNNGAPFICIEPWNGMADEADLDIEFSQKYGILCLDSAQSFECFYTVENLLK